MSRIRGKLLLETAIVLFWASEYCHVPYFTPYLNSLGLDAALVGAVVACYGLTQMLVRIPLGIVTDLSGAYKTVIVLGLVFTTVSSLGLFLTKNVALIFLCRVLAGMASSTWIATTVVYMIYFSETEQVAATARLNALNNGGKLLAFALGGVAAVLLGYRATLFMSFAAGLLGLLLIPFWTPVEIRRTPMSLSRVGAVLRSPKVLIPSLFMAVQQLVLHATVFSFTSAIAKTVGASSAMLSILSVVFTVVQIFAVGLVSSPLVTNAPRGRVIALGFTMLAGYLLILGGATGVWPILFGQAVAALGSALLASLLLAQCVEGSDVGERSTVVGVFQAVYGLGMTVGPLWMGKLLDIHSAVYSCGIFAVVCILTALGALLLFKKAAH